MSKKLYGLLLPALAIAAFATASTAAQAQPVFFICSKPGGKIWRFASESACAKGTPEVTNGEWERLFPLVTAKDSVKTHGTLTLHALGVAITCKVTDKGKVWDEGGVGHDEITEFNNTECKSSNIAVCPEPVTINSLGLPGTPWLSELTEAVPGEIRDAISGVDVELVCNGTHVPAFNKGTLEPVMVNGSPLEAEFDAASGELENTNGTKATVTGNDAVEGASGEAAGVE